MQLTSLVYNDYIVSKQLEFFRLVGIGTDGAAVMNGKNNGTIKKIIDFQLDVQSESSPNVTF